MRKKNIFEQLTKVLHDSNGEFRVLEHQVPVETQMEYFKNSNLLRSILPIDDKTDYEQLAAELYNPTASLEFKKQILSTLAITQETKSYRLLEKYMQEPEKELKDWAHMALIESRVTLESEFSDEKQIYISTGMGGKGNKLRYYILLLSSSSNPFLDYQRQVIEREFEYALHKFDGEIEELTIQDQYVEIVILAPIHADIKRILENVLSECNQYGDFISNTITVTNVKKLTKKEISEIIKKHEGRRSGN
ncbi:MAG: hypothetical protein LBE79_03650 [Tannerella sp.]|jgi:hypothetical protein|nr:hypothetical protein [Tannerella sp.]